MAETIFFIFVVNFPTSWLSVSADIVVKACYSFWCSTDGVVFSDRYYFWEYNHASSDIGCWTTRKTWPPGFLCKEVRWSVLLSHLEHLKVSKWVFALSSVDRETALSRTWKWERTSHTILRWYLNHHISISQIWFDANV